jgi:hypothetical protein
MKQAFESSNASSHFLSEGKILDGSQFLNFTSLFEKTFLRESETLSQAFL